MNETCIRVRLTEEEKEQAVRLAHRHDGDNLSRLVRRLIAEAVAREPVVRPVLQLMDTHIWLMNADTVKAGQKPYTVHMDDSGHFYREPKAFTRTYTGEDEQALLKAIEKDYELIEIN